MSSFSMLDCSVFVDAYDFTTDVNQLTIKVDIDDQDATTFQGNGYKARRAGLYDISADLEGYWQADDDSATPYTGAPDSWAFPNLAVGNKLVMFTPTETSGDPAFMFRGASFTYEMFGDIGDVTPFTLNMSNTFADGLVRGQLCGPRADVSATGVLGDVLHLGAPTTDQYLYAALHVFSAGTTITVDVESDDNTDFTSATTRGSFTGVTSTGGVWLTRVAAGAWTDEYWRMNVSAVTGTFNVAGAIGLQ